MSRGGRYGWPKPVGRDLPRTSCPGEATKRRGDAPAAGFAPRKSAMVIYLADGIGRHEKQLRQLGSHTTGVGCLYIRDLDKIDISVLESIVVESYGTVTADTYTLRAREGAAE